ncbi:MAG: hypothetical protein WDZ66_12170 [Steroidobacteraceae bacterium]
MNEPASVFDLGMLRLRQSNAEDWAPALQEKIQDLQLIPTSNGVVYDWNKNEISIGAYFEGMPTEKDCERVLRLYRDIISPFRRSPGAEDFAVGMLAHFFSHINYSTGAQSKGHEKELVGLMRFTVGIEEPDKIDPTHDALMRALSKGSGAKMFCTLTYFDDVASFTKFGFE